jgi:hypothetical protein
MAFDLGFTFATFATFFKELILIGFFSNFDGLPAFF